jgi:hypothetical protein
MIHSANVQVYEAPKAVASIEEFHQNKDGTSTLVVRCAKRGIEVSFTVKTDKVDELNMNQVYDSIMLRCNR